MRMLSNNLELPGALLALGRTRLVSIWPGLILTAVLAAAAFQIAPRFTAFPVSPLIVAVLLGFAFSTVCGPVARLRPGIQIAQKKFLRIAIVLLGMQISVQHLLQLGGSGILVVITAVPATMAFMLWLSKRLGVDAGLGAMVAVGTSICGASAVLAAGATVNGRDEDVAYAIGLVTLFGSILMFGYPLLQSALGLESREYGLWAGSSIHEVAQVAAATFQSGMTSGEFGLLSKLSRVVLLAPMLMMLGFWFRRRGAGGSVKAPFPWFVAGFVAMIAINSLGLIPLGTKPYASQLSVFLLAIALAAVGLEINFASIVRVGMRPLALGAFGTAFISLLTYTMIMVLGQ